MRWFHASVVVIVAGCFGSEDVARDVAGPVGTPPSIATSVALRLSGPPELVVGDQSAISARISWSGDARNANPNVTWTSSDPGAIEVVPCKVGPPGCGAYATLYAKGAGTATITGSIDGLSSSVDVTVAALGTAQAIVWSGATFVEVNPPAGMTASWATAINDSGHVVGYASANGSDVTTRAFVWDATRGAVDIGVLPGDVSSRAIAINATGEVVGWSLSMDGRRRAFRWTSSLGLLPLPVPPGTFASEPRGINTSGDIVGAIQGSTETFPYFWRRGGAGERVTTLGEAGEAIGLSDDGIVAGWSLAARDPTVHATLWSTGVTPTPHHIDPFACDPYPYADGCTFMAVAISRRGTVALTSDWVSTFVWTSSSGFAGVSPGDHPEYGFEPSGVNDAGMVSGNSHVTALQSRAVLSAGDSRTLTLALPGGRHISFAAGVNNAGQVAGYVR